MEAHRDIPQCLLLSSIILPMKYPVKQHFCAHLIQRVCQARDKLGRHKLSLAALELPSATCLGASEVQYRLQAKALVWGRPGS